MATKITEAMTGEQAVELHLNRGVKLHEFLMSGGLQKGYNADGIMQYGLPITVADNEVCPWHGTDCAAWNAIVAGDGYWTKMERELAGMKDLWASGLDSPRLEKQIAELTAKLEERPRDFKALRERTPEQFATERDMARQADYDRGWAKSGAKGKAPRVVPAANGRTVFNRNHPNPAEVYKEAEELIDVAGLAVSETFDVTGEEDE